MFHNFLKITFRNLWRTKSTSLINISGLSAGMCVALLIGLWVSDELTFDHFHENRRDLYQIMLNDRVGDGNISTFPAAPLPLVEVLRENVPEIKYVAEQDWGWEHGLMAGDKRLFKRGIQVHEDFLKMFNFPLIKGDVNTALEKSHSIILSEELAETLFGNQDPLGELVRIDNREDLMVTGVLKKIPRNTEFDFEYLVPFSYFEFSAPWVQQARTNWDSYAFQLYVQLQPGAALEQIESKIKNLVKENQQNATVELMLHPLEKWRLYSKFENGQAVGGAIEYVRLFGIIGTFVLLIACINFMNLSTARSEKRAREVGIRKVIGSERKQLIVQFLGESVIVALISFGSCLIAAELLMPYFNALTEKELSLPVDQPVFWAVSLGFVILTGLFAGSYPAFFLSSFKPVTIFKSMGSDFQIGKGSIARKSLVVAQFAISIGLIIGTLVIFRQIQYTKKRPSGYDPNRLVMVNVSPDLSRNFNALKNDLLASGQVIRVTKSSSPITAVFQRFPDVEWQGMQPGEKVVFSNVEVADDYFETTRIKMKEGRAFRTGSLADTTGIIFNEAAIEHMGLEDPIGQIVKVIGEPRTIIGVAENVVMTSPFDPVEPTMFQLSDWGESIMFRLEPGVTTNEALASAERIFQKHNPAYPFIYQFADEQYAKKFGREKLIGNLAGVFGGLAIFISCLGLFGLASFMAERRQKEIGIRKVLGASIFHLWVKLSKDFFLLVLISCLIASPVTAYLLDDWLAEYNYRTTLSWWVFAAAGVAALLLTLLTVSFQSVKAALANPVESLRSQ